MLLVCSVLVLLPIRHRGDRMLFYIASEMNNKVMVVKKADPKPSTHVIMWERHPDPAPNQLWWEDEFGNLHSKLNDMVLDTSCAYKSVFLFGEER